MDSLRDVGFWGLLVWSTYCIVSPKIDDGIVGKLFLMVVALGSMAALEGSDHSAYWVYSGVFLVFARCYFIALVWPHIVSLWQHKH